MGGLGRPFFLGMGSWRWRNLDAELLTPSSPTRIAAVDDQIASREIAARL
jgi:hypothetical protein